MIERAVAEHERGNVPARLQQIVRRRLPSDQLRIGDVAGATGVDAGRLSSDGNRVHLS